MTEFERLGSSFIASGAPDACFFEDLKEGSGPNGHLAKFTGICAIKPVFNYPFSRDTAANGWQVVWVEILPTGRVVRHMLIASDWDAVKAFWHHENTRYGSWEALSASPLMNPSCPHKRLRKEMSAERFLVECGATEQMAQKWAIRIRSAAEPFTFRVRTDIVDAYRDYNAEFWSCMTGSRSIAVESYATHPSRMVMGEAYRGDGLVGRFLLYRFQDRTDSWRIDTDPAPTTIEEAAAAGFIAGRVYGPRNSSGSPEDYELIRAIELALQDIGIVRINSDTEGFVSVKIGPAQTLGWFDDNLVCFYSGTDVGDRAVIVAGSAPRWASGWDEHENDSGGRYLPDRRDNLCSCENCGNEFDPEDEDSGHVNGWGHCCPSCYSEGIYCEDTCEVHEPGEVAELCWRGRPRNRYYVTHDATGCNISIGYGASRVTLADLTSATYNGETVVCPLDETVETFDGERHWLDTNDGTSRFVPINAQLLNNGSIEPIDGLADSTHHMLGEYVDQTGAVGKIYLPFRNYPHYANGKFKVVRHGIEDPRVFDLYIEEDGVWNKLGRHSFGDNNFAWCDRNTGICRAAIRMVSGVIGRCLYGWTREIRFNTTMVCNNGMLCYVHDTLDTGIYCEVTAEYRGILGFRVQHGYYTDMQSLARSNPDIITFDHRRGYRIEQDGMTIHRTWKYGPWVMLSEYPDERPRWIANLYTDKMWRTTGFDIPGNPERPDFVDFMRKLATSSSSDFVEAYNETIKPNNGVTNNA